MNPPPPDTPPTKNPSARLCSFALPLAVAVGIGAALGVSNGPAVGISIGAVLVLLTLVTRRR